METLGGCWRCEVAGSAGTGHVVAAEIGMLVGVAGGLLGTDSREEEERDCRGGESEPSLPPAAS